MKKYYSSLSKDELLEMLPNRTWSSVLTKANKININKRCMWTNEEDNLLIAIYENTDINEVVKKFSNRDKNSIVKRAMKLGLNSYNHPIWTKEDELYIINNWQLLPDEIIAQNIGKTKNAVKRKRNLLGLHRQDKSKKTYENITKYIRGNIYEWKSNSMKACNYECVLTKSKEFEIHHLYPVNKIVNDIFNKYNLEYKEFNEYTENELNNILQLFVLEQSKYPLGECIRKDLHMLFHSLYGQYNTTEEQWIQFKNDYTNGVYNNRIKMDIVA